MVIKAGGFSGVKQKAEAYEKNTLAKTVWKGSSFIDSQVADLVFTGMMEDCCFENCAFTRVTFKEAKLVNCFFKNKNLKGVRFIDCEADRLTYEFLKNGKADLTGIRLMDE